MPAQTSLSLVGARMIGAVPLRARLRLFCGVFLAFATVGILLDLSLVARRPWYGVVYSCLAAGMVSVGWAYAWQCQRRLLFVLAPLTLLYQPAFDFLFPQASLAQAITRGGIEPARIIEAAACLACVVAAYVFFIHYVRGEESRNQRIRTEMNLAQRIHETLVPPVAFSTCGCDIFGASLPSSEMGGDLLDWCRQDDTLTLIVADVSGHGVAAGVLMAMLKSAIRANINRKEDLGNLVREVNRVMHELTSPEKFATFSSLRIGPNRRVEYALAGHLPILWYQVATGRIVELANEHLPLGVVEDSDFDAHTVYLFVLLTDGLTEAMDASGELFGDERIRALIKAQATRPLSEMHATLMSAVSAHGPRIDDQTLLLVRIL